MDALFSSLTIQISHAHSRLLDTSWHDVDYCDGVTRLYIIERGEGWVRHSGRRFKLTRERAHLIPARTVFSFGCDAPFVQHWVHFNATLFGGLELFDVVSCRHEAPLAKPAVTLSLVRKLETLAADERIPAQLQAQGILLQLIAPFLESATVSPTRNPLLSSVGEVLQYIDAHLHERLAIGDLARKIAHLERTYFTKLFAQYTGMPPARYIQQRRIQLARELLLSGREPLRRIAEQLGFVDEFHFSRVFKKIAGMPPTQYRARAHRP
jgi:AraC-like DNA-binding protein